MEERVLSDKIGDPLGITAREVPKVVQLVATRENDETNIERLGAEGHLCLTFDGTLITFFTSIVT